MATATHAKVRFLHPKWRDHRERPEIGSRETRHAATEARTIAIRDARPLAREGALDLEITGFVLVENRSAVTDFYDPKTVESVYYPEVEIQIRALTGAADVFFLEHLIRTENPPTFNDAYARFLHCDFSPRNAHAATLEVLRERGLTLKPGRDWEFAWYNSWQPIEREVQQNPLTVLDASTAKASDFGEYRYTGDGGDNPSIMPYWAPQHRLYYFPTMQTHEMMIFKQRETRAGRGLPSAHTAFYDGSAPEDALGRRSIETRMICAFPAERSAR